MYLERACAAFFEHSGFGRLVLLTFIQGNGLTDQEKLIVPEYISRLYFNNSRSTNRGLSCFFKNSFTMNYKKAISDRFKSKSHQASTATIALALVGGIAVGAIVSLLFAPQSGEETRGMIADKTKDLASGVKDKFRAARSRFHANGEALSDHIKNGISS